MTRVAAMAMALLVAAPCLADCPSASGAIPAGFAYGTTDGRHSAEAVALLPMPLAEIAPIAAAVKAEPTWTNLEAKGSAPKAVKLRPLLEQGKLKEPRLDVEATADAQCPGATRVVARFSWSFGALARLAGGDAKDLPALFAIAVRDDVIARALTTPARAQALVGAAPAAGMTLVRVAPQGLDIPDAALKTLLPRLEALEAASDADMGDVLRVFYDIQRQATSLAGFGALSTKGATPTLVSSDCSSCDLGYDISVAETPDGKGGAISFGLRRYR